MSPEATEVREVSPGYEFKVAKPGVPEGYKQTEVGVIPEDWRVWTVFDIAERSKSRFDDGDWVEAEHITTKGIRLVQTGNVGIGKYIEKTNKKYVYESSFEKLRCKEIHAGDLLICRLAEPAGRACLLPRLDESKVITSVDVTIFRPSEKVADRRFLTQYFSTQNWFQVVLNSVGGTTHKRISRGALGKLPVPFPKVEEQHAIASALSDVDTLLEELDRLIAKKRDIKQATMQQLLTGQTRLPGFEGEWEERLVSDFGKVVTGGTPSTKVASYWGFEFPWITPTDIGESRDISIGDRSITELGLKEVRELPSNAILVTCIASIGKIAILRRRGSCNQQINAITPGSDYSPDFLYYLIEFNKQRLLARAGITATPIISRSSFEKMKFFIPSRKGEQSSIAAILSDIDDEVTQLKERRAKIVDLKKAMMQELLTGRIRLL